MEFPAAVSDDVAFVSQLPRQRRARTRCETERRSGVGDSAGKMAASPAIAGDVLVAHGMDGRVYVLDRHNGRVLWTYDVGAPIESSPLVRRRRRLLRRLERRRSTRSTWRRTSARWTYGSGCKITSSAAFAGGTIYIGDYGGRLLALSARTGGLRWSASVNGRIYGTPAVANGRVFVTSSTGGSLTAFSTAGARLWSLGTGSYVYSSPAVWNGRVYFGSYNGSFYAALRRDRRDAVALRRPPARSRAQRRRGRRRLLRHTASTGSTAWTRAPAGRSSASPTAPSCRSRATGAACFCTASRGCTPSAQKPMKRVLLGAAGAARARRAGARRPRSASTASTRAATSAAPRPEFVAHEAAADAAAADREDPLADVPLRRGAAGRRAEDARAAAVPAAVVLPRSARSSSSRPRSPTGGSTSPTEGSLRGAPSTGRCAGPTAHRCTAASPAVDDHTVYMTFLNKPPCNASRSGLDGQVVALNADTGKVRWR